SKIAYQEELQGAEEISSSDADDSTRPDEPAAHGDAECKAQVDNEHKFVEADEEISGEKSRQRQQKRDRAIAEDGASKNRHGPYRSEVPRMRQDAHNRSEKHHYHRGYKTEREEILIVAFSFNSHEPSPLNHRM